MTLEENINRLQEGKEAIKNELKNKGYTDGSVVNGVSLSTAKINQIAPFIAGISGGSSGVNSVNTLQNDITIEGGGISEVTTDSESNKIVVNTTLTNENITNALGFTPISNSSIGRGNISIVQAGIQRGTFNLNQSDNKVIYLEDSIGETEKQTTFSDPVLITEGELNEEKTFLVNTNSKLLSYSEITGITFDMEIYNAGNMVIYSYKNQIPLSSIMRRLLLNSRCEYSFVNNFMTARITYNGSSFDNGTDNIGFGITISFNTMSKPLEFYAMSLTLGFTYKGLSYAPSSTY